ncbi:Calcium/calmodulin-regulated receptor-like kinase 1 [Camellia lanceoleosa]|uniref:Calcium/calmodulin-regulated receptor-like kinase 1 n=1 Tax=Camellia lanceoleosa TaxID=1840588 RepID=A0ACC0HJC8_9ERIC|nr:Calcium/calmodulin-regulated receptor-like kinase 1 [Camellia lanceoleosa]
MMQFFGCPVEYRKKTLESMMYDPENRCHPQIENSSSRRAAAIPIRANGVDSCTALSDSSVGTESPKTTQQNGMPLWLGVGLKKANVVSASGILKYTYKDLQIATCNFTTLIGQGAFGPVYKAQMLTGETITVKVLAIDSNQGAKEFQTECTSKEGGSETMDLIDCRIKVWWPMEKKYLLLKIRKRLRDICRPKKTTYIELPDFLTHPFSVKE